MQRTPVLAGRDLLVRLLGFLQSLLVAEADVGVDLAVELVGVIEEGPGHLNCGDLLVGDEFADLD